MESQHFLCQQENMENKDFYGTDLGVSNVSLASIDCADLSDRGILTERNSISAGSRERKSPNSGIHFDHFFYEDRSKHQHSMADLMGIGCRCDLGSSCKSNFSSIRSKSRNSQGVEIGLKPSTVTSEEKICPANESKLEIGGRSPYRVASEGNLNELEYELEFGSSLLRRSVSPKVRTSQMVSDLSKTKRCRCVCELGLDSKENQIHQSPNYGLHFPPNENPGSKKSKPSNTPRMDYFSPRRQCFCNKPKPQKRNAYSSYNLQEELIGQSICNEPGRMVNFGSKKGNSGFSRICKVAIVWVFLVILFLHVLMKERSFLRPKFGTWYSSQGINQTELSFNPVDLGSNHSEDANLERQIKPYIEEGSSSRGEIEENIKSLASNETVLIEEGVGMLEPNFTEIPVEENTRNEELRSESEHEFKSENAKQCGMLDFIVDGLEEGLVTIPVKKIGHVALLQTDINNREEDRKVKMRIRFCVAFISVVVCASLVSCIVRREQFGEMLARYSSSNKGEKSSKKRARRDSCVLLEGSYGSIVTYEKISTKKRGGGTDGLLTPVRRSSRIRNYLASPS